MNTCLDCGKKICEVAKRCHSCALKGNKNSPKFMTNEAKAKISQSLSGRILTKLHREKISKSHFGKRLSSETLNKIRKENHHSYKDGRTFRLYWCKNCGNPISASSGFYGLSLCLSCCRKGKLNPNYLDGVSVSEYGDDFTNALRENIRKRVHFQCRECGCSQEELFSKLDVHHIDYDKKNNTHENLISLCRKCHMKTNYKRQDWSVHYSNVLKKQDFSYQER